MTGDRFDSTVDIWIYKPHVVHRKIFGADVVPSDDGSQLVRTVVTRCSSYISEVIQRSYSESLFESDHTKYLLFIDNGKIASRVLHNDESSVLTTEWILLELPKKLNKWFAQVTRSLTTSLSLVNLIAYHELYRTLKTKYAKHIVQNWCEKTDPLKFVHEDIAIASYLICLWKHESAGCTHFVDIGCGNGLLVYLLLLEGFRGIGVDVRKRMIWSTYPDLVRQNLHEVSLDAEQSPGFSNADWLIGNHSDELTPWLPILAARSGPTCRIFALPCCAFGLYGRYNNFSHRYRCINPNSSQTSVAKPESRHSKYINYLGSLFHLCGFIPEYDTLRIPSTKRVCIIGRKFHSTDHSERLARIDRVIAGEKLAASATAFVPRAAAEPVFNCTQVPVDVKRSVCDLVFAALLRQPPDELILEMHNLTISNSGRIRTTDGRWWNPGGRLSLSELSKLMPRESLAAMKTQHGGLQTLLRNHYQAFNVMDGLVHLRWLPAKISKCGTDTVRRKKSVAKLVKRKTKPCWMFANHPDGCPYTEAECDFVHAVTEA